MILQKLILKNFRQFRGTQEIEFAAGGKSRKKQNVTVIFGENGRGKTGIYRAVMFCLYGDRLLSQDGEVEQKELQLVNKTELEESSLEKKPVETFVELLFSHKGEQFQMKRSLLGLRDGEDTVEQLQDLRLVRTKADGNAQIYEDPHDIDAVINSILDERVREYFLFDGEKMERLTLASAEQRREVSKGIRNLLNIDSLEKAIGGMSRLRKSLDQELSKVSTGEFRQILQNIQTAEDHRKKLVDDMKVNEEELQKASLEKKDLDKKLEKIGEIRGLLEERKAIENDLKEKKEEKANLLETMKGMVGKASTLLIGDLVEEVFISIDQRKKKGEIPSEIRKDLIERILLEKKCICGRSIKPKTKEFDEIIQWKNKTEDVEIQASALDLWRFLSSISSHQNTLAESVETNLQKYAICQNDIDLFSSQLEKKNEELGTSEREDISELEKLRESVDRKVIKLEAEKLKYQQDLEEVNLELTKLNARRIEKEREEGIKNELTARATLVYNALEALRSVYDDFTEEIKNLIGRHATEYFERLLDDQSKKMLRQIIVKDDYTLQVLDRWNMPFLANISAGQRQIMSISFIAALAREAAGDKEVLEMPLFMDTPFGRLSYQHRENLIKNVPGFAAQWVLLATGTELRKPEAELLRKGGKWGKFYALKPADGDATKIVEYSIEESVSQLNDAVLDSDR